MSLVTFPRQFLVDVNGQPRVGAKAYFYRSGTSTPIVTYTTAAYDTPHSHPVLSLGGGLFPAVYVNSEDNPAYKIVVTDANDVELYSNDAVPALGFTGDDLARLLYPQTAEESAASVTPTNYHYPPGHVNRYGAVGDGATDSTAAIQAAINSSRASGGVVTLVDGVYKIAGTLTTGPLDNRRTVIVGYGAVLKQFSSGANTLNIRNSRVSVVGVRFEADAGVVKNRNFSAIDVLDVSNVSVTDCVFFKLPTRGIIVRADEVGNASDVSIKGCHFIECAANSVEVGSSDDLTYVRRVSVIGCTFNSPPSPVDAQTRAIHVTHNSSDIAISANVCSGVATEDYLSGWRDCFMIGVNAGVKQPRRVSITGNVITGMADDGVGISGAVDITVSGNVIHDSKVTSGIYVPGSGIWSNDNITISGNTIFDCKLAGITLKDTLSYSISGNLIHHCKHGIYVNGSPATINRGIISSNTIHTVASFGIHWDAGVCNVTGNLIDGYGDVASGSITDKAAIFMAGAGAGSVVNGNVMMNGIHGLVLNSNPSGFVVGDNVVRPSCTGYGLYFVGFTGSDIALSNNQLDAASGPGVNQPANLAMIGNGTQSTVGAAGGASALPATPAGYLQVSVGAGLYVLPFYAAS